jgi:hypothetical protein
MQTRAWRILRLAGREPMLLCLVCDRVSSHPADIGERYCGACHLWLDEIPLEERLIEVKARCLQHPKQGEEWIYHPLLSSDTEGGSDGDAPT